MDESSFLSQILNFFQSGLNWATPSAAPSVAATGTPMTGTVADNFDLPGAGVTTQNTGNWLSASQGAYSQDFAFLSNTFNNSNAFLQSIATPVVSGMGTLGQQETQAQTAYAGALSNLAAAQHSSGGLLGGLL